MSCSVPASEQPFDKAREKGVIRPGLESIGGTWSSIGEHGEATYLNMVHMLECDGTDVRDLTRAEMEGRRQAKLAIKALQPHSTNLSNPTKPSPRRYAPRFSRLARVTRS
jgi:hypothetical protein